MTIKDNLNTLNELTNQGGERLNALGELNLRVVEQLTARQMDVFNLYLEQGVRMLQLATDAKGFGDLYKGQVEMTKDLAERLMSESKANVAIANEMRDAYRGWFDGAMADVKAGKDVVRNAVIS